MFTTNRGFTIVELLIVIVVIAILAAISVVAYNGIQVRSRDTIRKQDVAQLEKAFKLYQVDNGNYMNAASNCGNGNGDGTLYFDYDGAGPRISIYDCLKNGNYLSQPINDPCAGQTCSGKSSFEYVKYGCGLGTFIYAKLESLPTDTTATDGTCAGGIDSQGFNYFTKF